MDASDEKEFAFFQFPPFFTLQPVPETRQKQLELWRSWLISQKVTTCGTADRDGPIFKNAAINRGLSDEGITTVLDFMVSSGHGFWMDSDNKSLCFLTTKTISQMADDLMLWVGCCASSHSHNIDRRISKRLQNNAFAQYMNFGQLSAPLSRRTYGLSHISFRFWPRKRS